MAHLLAAAAIALHSGLYGVVTRGPVTPVCNSEEPCSAPYAGAVLRFVRNGVVVQATTDAQGRYRIRLAPGTYTVRLPRGAVETEVVRSGSFTHADFDVDTGIR